MRTLAVLPVAAALFLWAAPGPCLGRRKIATVVTDCPAYCAAKVYFHTPNGGVEVLTPKEAKGVKLIETRLIRIKPTEIWINIAIGKHNIRVPGIMKLEVTKILKNNPRILYLVIEILKKHEKKLKASTTTRKTRPTTKKTTVRTTTTKRTTRKTTKKVTTTTTKRTTTTPKPTKARTTRKTKPTTKATRKVTPKPTQPPHQPLGPTGATTRRLNLGGSMQLAFNWSITSNMQMPDFRNIFGYITAVPGIEPKALILLGYLFSQPNYFPVIYQLLIHLGFKFPSLSVPVTSAIFGGIKIPFPQPLVVSYRVKVQGGEFQVPRDAPKLALYLSKHDNELTAMAKFLSQLGGAYTISGGSQITGFTIFNQFYRFPKPMVTTVVVSGRSYVLPKDIDAILVAVKNKPKEFYSIKILLEAFGVRFSKANNPALVQALNAGKSHNINILPGVRIIIDNKPYDIPADLETIFKKTDGFKVGALLSALQEKGVPVKVDDKTGVIVGILLNNVLVPFPYSIDLRFKLDSKLYMIPRDLKKLIATLEKKNMPSEILSILYNRYGVIPVRNSAKIVIAISFNGIKYPVKVEPVSTVVIRKRKFLLPRDTSKMVLFVDSLKNDKKIGFEFLRALKVAGFMFVHDDDGVMRSIQKGAQVIELGMEVRIRVQHDKKHYNVPKDLMRLVKDVRKLSPRGRKQVTEQLKAFGVQVTKKGNKLTILFSSVKYVVDLKSGSVQG